MLVFILIGAVSASENVTDTSTNNDVVTGDVLASPDNSQSSSVADSNNNVGQTLINGVSAGGNLTLDKNYKFYPGDDSAYVNGVNISGISTFNGAGFTIDGSGVAPIFDDNSNNITFNNVNFVNAFTSANGAVFRHPYNVDVNAIKNPNFAEPESSSDPYGIKYWTRSDKSHIGRTGDTGGVSFHTYITYDLTLTQSSVDFSKIHMLEIKINMPSTYLGYLAIKHGSTIVESFNQSGTYTVDLSQYNDIADLALFATSTVSYTFEVVYLKVIPTNANLNFNNCNFTNCTATGDGGAINYGSTSLNVSNLVLMLM